MKLLFTMAMMMCVGPFLFSASAEEAGEDAILSHSLVSMGDLARLQRALAKARRGEAVTVAVIGGSITGGAKASTRDKNYGSLIAKWWRETFPKAKRRISARVDHISNAAAGGMS